MSIPRWRSLQNVLAGFLAGFVAGSLVCTALGAQAQPTSLPTPQEYKPFKASVLALQPLHIRNADTPVADLVCPRKGPTPSRSNSSNSPKRASTTPAEPTEIPDDDEVEQALKDALKEALKEAEETSKEASKEGKAQNKALLPSGTGTNSTLARTGTLRPINSGPWRIAIWGDSHMAAAFFSDQLLRQLTVPAGPNTVSSRFVNAGVGHGGVRALVRKTCLSGDWGREVAYAHPDAAAAPGPGMTSLVAKRPGATLALDLRDAQGQVRHTRLQLLHHGDPSGPTRLAISVDGEAETLVTLTHMASQAGPSALALSTDAPMSTLQIRVVEGPFRFQGLKLANAATTTTDSNANTATPALHLDLFAYPGATVAGWVRSDLPYLAAWFTDQPYDVGLIAFGTNEGNDPRFNEAAYRDTLSKALGHFRQVFPQTQCVLIGPGDRGIRVAKPKVRPTKSKAAKSTKGSKNSKAAQPSAKVPASTPSANLLKYSRIHAQIGQIQAELAAQYGCQAWSMQSAMGGAGSAYTWTRKSPALMAPDLIHFTPAGYRELANRFMADFGLTAP